VDGPYGGRKPAAPPPAGVNQMLDGMPKNGAT
jgi:hypothetical protein